MQGFGLFAHARAESVKRAFLAPYIYPIVMAGQEKSNLGSGIWIAAPTFTGDGVTDASRFGPRRFSNVWERESVWWLAESLAGSCNLRCNLGA
jgi:hypothetical protein